jgi:peptide/nickel transport system substrate-binding protein
MKLRPRAIAAAFATFAIALTGCSAGGSGEGSSGPGETLTIGADVDVQSFDPAQAHIGQTLQFYQPVYDSLLRREADGTLVPMLATEWEYDQSGTELTLTLRDDVSFTDGSALDADAVKLNLERFLTGNGPQASTFGQVADVQAPDSTTVVINLKAPDPALLDYLGNAAGFIASPKAIESGDIATTPVGSGPYVLEKSATVAGSKYTFVRNEDYWDPALQVYDSIVVKPLIDTTAMLNALLSGQINAGILSAKSRDQAVKAGMTEYRYPIDWLGLLLFDRDGEKVPAFADVRVRQALNYAVDKEAQLEQVQQGFGTLTNQVFGPSTPAYDEALDDRYPYDPEKAKELLAEAGYADGFEFTMPTVSGWFDPAHIAGITQNFADVGVTVQWENITDSEFLPAVTQGEYAAASWSLFQGTPWVAANQMITPDAPYNPLHTTNATVEELLSKIQTGSESEQAEAAKELNRYVTEEAWFLPLYRPDQIFFTDAKTTTTPLARKSVPSIYSYAPAE